MRLLILFLLMASSACGQILLTGTGSPSLGGISIGAHCFTDNGASNLTTVACTMTPTAGSTIYCDVKPGIIAFTSMADNVNSGSYQPGITRLRDSGHSFEYGSYYKENVAGSATTITYTQASATTHSQIACKEIKGTPAKYTLDSTVLQSQAVNGTNPANPNSYTPFANNEIVLVGGVILSGVVTAGANFTLLDNTSTLYPQYWIQTTKTATTGPFSDSTATDNAVGMAAFGPNIGGNCDANVVIDWTGGTNGNAPTATTLQNSTKGLQAQPNSDTLSNKPGWAAVGGSSDITYNTAAGAALATTRNCPFYSGTGNASLGLDQSTAAAGSGTAFTYDNQQSKTTLAACMSPTMPVSHTGTMDVMGVYGGDNYGNADFAQLQWNSNGSTSSFALEVKGGTTTSSTHWVQNTWYWVRIEFNQASTHKMYIYTFSGSQCQGTPTLQETITAGTSVAGGGPSDALHFFGNANTYASGSDFYVGTAIADTYYGGALLP